MVPDKDKAAILRRMAVAALFLLTVWGAAEVVRMALPHFGPGWADASFYDFRLWREGLEEFDRTGRLYDVDTPGYYLPGSHSQYKYPPTFAALLRPLVHAPQRLVGRAFLLGDLALLVLSFLILITAARTRARVVLLAAVLYATWRPIWEDIADLQMEPILLLCLVAAWVRHRRGPGFLAGVAIGVAGAFKVYPWALLAFFAARRDWRAIAGGLVGAVGTLALAALILPARLSLQFFTEILPRLGGTAFSYENVSLLANTCRLALALTVGMQPAESLDTMYLEAPGPASTRWLAVGLALVLAVAAGWFVARRVRAERIEGAGRRGTDWFCVSVCALVFLIPTSWMSYQTLLALPLLVALTAQAGRGCPDPPGWLLLGAGAAIGCTLYSYDRVFEVHPTVVSLARSLLPLLLAGVLIRQGKARLAASDRPVGPGQRTNPQAP